MGSRIDFGNYYFHPQISFIEDHIGFSVNSYWNKNDVAKYFALGFMIVNLSILFTFGYQYPKE